MSQPTALSFPNFSGGYSAVKKIGNQFNVADRAQFLGYTQASLDSNFTIILSFLIIWYVIPYNEELYIYNIHIIIVIHESSASLVIQHCK